MVQRIRRKPEPEPVPDLGLLTLEQLAERWQLYPERAREKARQAGIAAIRISQKTIRYRVVEVLQYEAECADKPLTADQLYKLKAMKDAKQAKRAAQEAAR